jgi:hypothetical protein
MRNGEIRIHDNQRKSQTALEEINLEGNGMIEIYGERMKLGKS